MSERSVELIPAAPKQAQRSRSGARVGLICGVSAYTLWGVFPLYFKALASVPPLTVLCHRVVWSALFMAMVISVRKEWSEIAALVRSRKRFALLVLGSILIALNWLIFIYAVGSSQLLQASLGYFINPLLSIALGMLFLREKLRTWQWVAVAIALVAILNLAVRAGGLPWIALSLAVTFGFYGLVRKKLDANSVQALLVETVVLFPISLALLFKLPAGEHTAATPYLLGLLGVVTAVPLLLFGAAVRRLSMSTFGFLQYVGPTLQFLVATVLFKEPLNTSKLVSFILCWIAIAIYIAESVWQHQVAAPADEPD